MTEKIFLENLSVISNKIEDIVWELDVSYMEACLIYCERNNVEDVEQFADMIKRNQNIRAKIEREAEDLHYIPKSSRLPY